ncbi:putative NACHT family NTPase [Paenibacillus sp. W4I10]|uniref:pentapeptide repeat-containing protein n=1 Tax=Paenibacillus sp. W4I10 TaxID=3042298 RepID=UPI00277EA538|nr:pentapeptide repeat-containing protein [Paenibacillus sp. W4I10]MDQ0723533.1 putative NACHT family NTPase [Paenibacillus sp. W4I10]
MDLLLKVSESLIKIAIPPAVKIAQRNEHVIRLLKKFNLDPTHPPSDFDSVYAYTLVVYGVYRPRELIDFFKSKSVKEAFKEAFNSNNPSKFLNESHSSIDWSEIELILDGFDYDPRREYVEFSAVFNEIVDSSRFPAEVRRDHRLDQISDDIHIKTSLILEQLSKLDGIDEMWEKINNLQEKRVDRKFVLASRDFKLRVFISCHTVEFRDVKEILVKELEERGINAWVFTANNDSAPESIITTSIQQVEAADLYIGLFGSSYSELSEREYTYARQNSKPCFVYIRDEDSSRDIELTKFLDNEVFDKHKGVTYSFFNSALTLGYNVAESVMKWLLQKHREMTAELAEAKMPYEEVVTLKNEINRLKSISKSELPEGTAADYLASQVKPWFEVLGYKFEEHNVISDDYFEWIINIQARRGYDRVLIRGVSGEAQLSDVLNIRSRVEHCNVDEGWLIAARRISQAAEKECKNSNNSKIICYTLDELLDESANFDQYLAWLEQEIKSRGIDINYIPLNCSKEEHHPVTFEEVGVSVYDEANGGIDGYIDKWLDDPDKKHISVLGEFGTGKSWFSLHYAWVALKRYQDAKLRGTSRPRIPLIIPLRDYAKAVSVESLFSEFFFRKHKIDLPNYGAFEQLNRMGKLLLIFDGFDEMAAKIDRQSMVNNFWELAKVVKPGAKAILTCRKEHFPEAKEGRSLLNAELLASTSALTGEPPQFEVLELLKLNENQIREILSKQTSKKTVDHVMENEKLLELVDRPIMIEFIVDALPDIDSGKPIDLSRIYLYAVQRKMDRDITEMRTFTSMADKMYFLCEVAWEMLSNDQMSLNYREFPSRINRFFGNIVQNQKNLDHWHYDMMGQTILIRNSEGDYTPAHRSLLEFFVAYKFASELGLLAEDFVQPIRNQSYIDKRGQAIKYTWSNYFNRTIDEGGGLDNISPLDNFVLEDYDNLISTFGHQPLSKALIDLMINMIDRDKASNLIQVIMNTKFKSTDEVRSVGGNATTILNQLDINYLLNTDLSHTNLSNANLVNSNFVGFNFDNAILENVNFRNANLKGCSLKNANLSGARLEHTSMRDSILTGATMRNIFILGDGWITATKISESGREIVFYYPGLSQTHVPEFDIVLEEGDIGIVSVVDNVIQWSEKFDSSFIVDTRSMGEKFCLLTLEGNVICFDNDTGEKIAIYNKESVIQFFRWEGAVVNNTYELDDYNRYLISVLGGLTEKVTYDTTIKRWNHPYRRQIMRELAAANESTED